MKAYFQIDIMDSLLQRKKQSNFPTSEEYQVNKQDHKIWNEVVLRGESIENDKPGSKSKSSLAKNDTFIFFPENYSRRDGLACVYSRKHLNTSP